MPNPDNTREVGRGVFVVEGRWGVRKKMSKDMWGVGGGGEDREREWERRINLSMLPC